MSYWKLAYHIRRCGAIMKDFESREITKDMDYKKTPLWKESLSLEERLDFLVKELTLEEKISCVCTKAPEIKRLGITSFALGGEAAHGVEARHDQSFNQGTPVATTVFTQPIGMSSTWDIEVIEKAGTVVGTEARAVFKLEEDRGLSRWAPTVDMERDPRWGRTEEGYGEDPFLTGKMSSAYIQGLQGRDDYYLRCAATLKHFYANNEEEERTKSSSSVDSRNKMEYYLEPFRRAIVEGGAEAVMTSYNEINGIPAILNKEVQGIVKDQWGLKGHVVCDAGDMGHTVTEHHYFETHAETIAYGLKTGVDAFSDPEEEVIKAAKEASAKGLITEEDLNRSIRNTFSTKLRLGLYDGENKCPYTNIDTDYLNCSEHQEICLSVAKKAVILLKNESNILPIKGNTKESLAIVGPLAAAWNLDWYSGIPHIKITPYDGIREEFPHTSLSFEDGIDRIKIKVGEQYLAVKEDGTCYLSKEEDAELFEHMDWGNNKHTLRATSIQKYLTTEEKTGCIRAKKEEIFSWFVEEAFSIYAMGEGFTSDGLKNESLFEIQTWNKKSAYLDKEGILRFENGDEREDRQFYGKGTMAEEQFTKNIFSFQVVTDGIEEAVRIAASADKVIAVMGCHPIISCKEETDRVDLKLPPKQRELLQRMKQVNPNIILVLITNYPYAIEWEKENLPAILTTASGSQFLGTAIAKAISGEYSPAGRLNMTWYQSEEQLPPKRDYDIIHGKRTYQYFDGHVLYPFGYGLTYTEFIYSDLEVQKEENQLNIKVHVKNVGTIDSDEVIQLYVSQLYSRTIRPMKQLKGFQRVFLKAGEERAIQFSLPFEELKYYDVVTGSMVLEDSDYRIQIGASSEDIRLQEEVHIDGSIIASRDMTEVIPSDHYDSYVNIYLHKGHDGKPCILPKDMPNSLIGKAIYHDVVFSVAPESLVVDLKVEEESTLLVKFGKVEIAKVDLVHMTEFEEITIPIKDSNIMVDKKDSLEIEIQGRIRVVEFVFR